MLFAIISFFLQWNLFSIKWFFWFLKRQPAQQIGDFEIVIPWPCITITCLMLGTPGSTKCNATVTSGDNLQTYVWPTFYNILYWQILQILCCFLHEFFQFLNVTCKLFFKLNYFIIVFCFCSMGFSYKLNKKSNWWLLLREGLKKSDFYHFLGGGSAGAINNFFFLCLEMIFKQF